MAAPKNWKIRNICQTINFFDMRKEQKLFIMKKHTFLSNFIKISQKLTKLSTFKILQKCEKLCFFHVFSLYFEKYQFYIYFVRTKIVPNDLLLLHAKLQEKILINHRFMSIWKNPRWPPKNIKFNNICKTINIFDTLKEQKLFPIKKYTFHQNFINIEPKIKKLCPLEKCKKWKSVFSSRYFSR